MSVVPGTEIGPYRVEEQIGRGGMATVYKAYQSALARFVAVKVLPEFLASEPGFKERFQLEAVAVARLRHPNIVAVYDYSDSSGTAYIVSEYVEGGTLAQQMGKALPPEYVITTLRPVAAALDYAHARGIIHRDVKPSNILLGMSGSPVLGDFGLVKMVEGGPALTQTGTLIGTPAYMSPEQCTGRDVGPATDLYALGIIAYEMLTGKLPYDADTPAAVINAQVTGPLPSARVVNPALPGGVDRVLAKALAKRPQDRYPDAGAFVAALETAISSPASRRTPLWVQRVFAAAIGLEVLWGLLVAISTGASHDIGTRALGYLIVLIAAPTAVICVTAYLGIRSQAPWGRAMAWIAGVALIVSCGGAVLGVPALLGLWISRRLK